MKISKIAYGFIIIGVLFGGLIITKLLGVWDVTERGKSGDSNRHAMSSYNYVIEEQLHKN